MGRGAGARVRLLVAVVLCAAGALAGCGDDAGERTGSIVVPRPCDTRPDADDAYAGFPVDDVPVVDGEVANTWNGRDNGEWGCTVEIRRTELQAQKAFLERVIALQATRAQQLQADLSVARSQQAQVAQRQKSAQEQTQALQVEKRAAQIQLRDLQEQVRKLERQAETGLPASK